MRGALRSLAWLTAILLRRRSLASFGSPTAAGIISIEWLADEPRSPRMISLFQGAFTSSPHISLRSTYGLMRAAKFGLARAAFTVFTDIVSTYAF